MRSSNPISLEALETLDAIDRRGSFAKAAEELNKATSAISYTVQKLEEQLDITVFQRQGRRSVLTQAGELLLIEGREILKTSARLADAARELATGWETRIRIAAESILAVDALFSVLNKFTGQHPSVELDVQECVLNGGWELLSEGEVDLIVGAPGPVPKHQGFRSIRIAGSHLVPVISASHPMSQIANNRESLAIELHNITRIITHDSSRKGVKRSAGLSSQGRHFYVQNQDQKIHAILAGIGIGHLPHSRIRDHLDRNDLLILDIEGSSPNESYIAHKMTNKGKGLQALVKLLEKEFQ